MAKKFESLTIEELTDKLVAATVQARQTRRKAETLLKHAAELDGYIDNCKARIAELSMSAEKKPEPSAEAIAQSEALRKFHA